MFQLWRVCLVVVCLWSQDLFAWGFKGHEAVNKTALSMMVNTKAKQFLEANQTQIIKFANTPDTKWKSGDSRDQERPMHWFEMDAYGVNRLGKGLADLPFSNAREELGSEYVNQYGLAIWRISDFYTQLVGALAEKDFKRAVQIAGVMGHYVGDMTQPMHATSDYDGQSINKPGAHKYYETTLVDQIDGSHLFDSVLKCAGERRSSLERSLDNHLSSSRIQHVIWGEATESFQAVADVYRRFDMESPEDQWLKQDLVPRVGRAAALLGKLWDVAFNVADGMHELPSDNVGAEEPNWIPMSER